MKKKILIVDDDERLVDGLQRFLTAEGHTVSYCYSGDEAMDLPGEDGFDVILADYYMPGMNGAEVAKKMRGRFENSLIIGCSGRTKGKEFLLAGADVFLEKPFSLKELVSLIDRHGSDGAAGQGP